MKNLMTGFALLIAASTFGNPESTDAAHLEPGPENGGLRLRLVVLPRSDGRKEGYDVRLASSSTPIVRPLRERSRLRFQIHKSQGHRTRRNRYEQGRV